jgi:hypothetical protein
MEGLITMYGTYGLRTVTAPRREMLESQRLIRMAQTRRAAARRMADYAEKRTMRAIFGMGKP